jgi:hypothetical protein
MQYQLHLASAPVWTKDLASMYPAAARWPLAANNVPLVISDHHAMTSMLILCNCTASAVRGPRWQRDACLCELVFDTCTYVPGATVVQAAAACCGKKHVVLIFSRFCQKGGPWPSNRLVAATMVTWRCRKPLMIRLA